MKIRLTALSALFFASLFLAGCHTMCYQHHDKDKACPNGKDKACAHGKDKAGVQAKACFDVTGTWTTTWTGRNGQTHDVTFRLTQKGDELTGVIVGRNNEETPIQEGSIKGGHISFTVTRERNGQKVTIKHEGDLTGDTIKGHTEYTTAGGEPRTREWVAKRAS